MTNPLLDEDTWSRLTSGSKLLPSERAKIKSQIEEIIKIYDKRIEFGIKLGITEHQSNQIEESFIKVSSEIYQKNIELEQENKILKEKSESDKCKVAYFDDNMHLEGRNIIYKPARPISEIEQQNKKLSDDVKQLQEDLGKCHDSMEELVFVKSERDNLKEKIEKLQEPEKCPLCDGKIFSATQIHTIFCDSNYKHEFLCINNSFESRKAREVE